MVLTTIYIIRHGSRPTWNTNPITGKITSSIPSPTGNPSDPPLTAHGVLQSKEVANHFASFKPEVRRIYSSPYYRCIQTIWPLSEALGGVDVCMDGGLGEWYGIAPFTHPGPAPLSVLQQFFPSLTEKTSLVPINKGESIAQLHDRCALALSQIIAEVDELESPESESIVIASHAAPIIAMGRALTGHMPEDPNEVDFHTYVCSISKFVRRNGTKLETELESKAVHWKGGKGVGGGWYCEVNAGVEHLSHGGERDWTFSGDEAFVFEISNDPNADRTALDTREKSNAWKL